ncbi:RES domain-containing protein (plasmid) [Sphingomonas paeninsulae]|uniref:RES domain-containing protein n=1 Tax=Sphingomonas paeninsulae TaxID=2319844 RepID=A0A494THC4_SPHPE|nr:RES family NAD+ phosphorylase [Sphingomonas paeninsulae]AYJ84828.1 RES domain-containing protein [Sphingomonas paeninsulae]
MTSAPASDIVPTPADFRPYRGKVWRLVEAQHRISTNRLAGNAEDQALLENLVEDVKPTLPLAARGFHYLLSTPFRYGHSRASRFRRANERPGIFYASEHVETAVAETAYWRLLFFSRSPGFRPPTTVVEHSALTVPVTVSRALDLMSAPFDTQVALWMDPGDYSACQAFAAKARTIDAQLIRYGSVRDHEHRANIAMLDPKGFAAPTPTIEQTWHFRYEAGRITVFAAFPSIARYSFTFEIFGLLAP